MSRNVVVIGTQWGDEGKGAIVDLLAERLRREIESDLSEAIRRAMADGRHRLIDG